MRAWGRSDVGRVRKNNEDAFLIDESLGLFAVADGVGGGPSGELASSTTIEELHAYFQRATKRLVKYRRSREEVFRKQILAEINRAMRRANEAVFGQAQANPKLAGMASTLVTVLVLDRSVFVGHVGDSRLYLIRQNRIYQLTEDHSIGQRMVREGRLRPEDLPRFPYKNVLERSIGSAPDVRPDTFWINVEPGDLFLLCSDGLSDFVSADAILSVQRTSEGDEFVRRLIKLANRRGGTDNITAVVIEPVEQSKASVVGPLDWTLRMEHLRRVFLFQRLNDQELLRVLRAVYEEEHPPGTVLIREGERGDRLHVLVRGTVEVSVQGVKLQRLRAGSHFGELALVDNAPRSATVKSTDSVHLLTIGREDFLDLVREDSQLGHKLLWAFLGDVTERLRAMSHDLVQLKQHLRRNLTARAKDMGRDT